MSNVTHDTVLVGFDNASGDNPVLIIGRKRPNESVEIINAFDGQEAIDIYEKLVTKKG